MSAVKTIKLECFGCWDVLGDLLGSGQNSAGICWENLLGESAGRENLLGESAGRICWKIKMLKTDKKIIK